MKIFTLAPSLLLTVLAGCTPDRPESPMTPPTGPDLSASAANKVSVCHSGDRGPVILEVAGAALTGHQRHGDYVAQLHVDRGAGGDPRVHFSRITDALAAARSTRIARGEVENAGCRITITVASGLRAATTAAGAGPDVEQLPLIIDVPDITVQGALQMEVDAKGRATGVSAQATTIRPAPHLVTTSGGPEPIFIVNGHPDGPMGHGAVIEGFALQSGRAASDTGSAGVGVLAVRVRNLVVRDNRFEGGFANRVDLRATTTTFERNHLEGRGSSCDVCLAGPGAYVVRNSRIVGGGIPGVLIFAAVRLPVPPQVEQYDLPAAAHVTAAVHNNEVRDHRRRPVGNGLRIGAVGIGAPEVRGSVDATFTDNDLVGNTFGMIIDAGFVRVGSRGDITLATSGNTISGSCQHHLLVAMTFSQTALGIAAGPILRNSTFTLAFGGDVSFDTGWYSHPAGQGNILRVNGEPVQPGARHAYDAARVCSP